MKIRLSFLIFFITLFFLPFHLYGQEKNTVFVSILPQKQFMQQICNDLINIEVMVKPGASPATYEPKSSQMRALAKSDAYFSIGVPFEDAWLDRIAGVNPKMKIIHTDEGIEKREMAAHHHHEEEAHHDEHEDAHHDEHKDVIHNDDKHHDEHDAMHHDEDKVEVPKDEHAEGLDPHIWLSPTLVKQQLQTTAKALSSLYPEHQGVFEKNLATFIAKIDTLDKQLHNTLAGKEGMKFMVFHPSWGYFADEYHLEQIAIEIEGKNPKPAQVKELIEHAKEENIQVIFAQPQFSTKSAKIIAKELKGTVLFLDPLAEDWLGNMVAVSDQLAKTLK